MKEERQYQTDLINSIEQFISDGKGNPGVEMPTGTGKGTCIALGAQRCVNRWRARVGVLTSRARLIQQNLQDLRELQPDVDAGVYSAGLGRRDVSNQIMFMQIQSVWNKQSMLDFDVLFVDECHEGGQRYEHYFAELTAKKPDAVIVGMTANFFNDSRRTPLTMVDGFPYDQLLYKMSIDSALEGGWLCPLVVKDVGVSINMEGVGLNNDGEFLLGESAARADTDEVNASVVQHALDAMAEGRRAGMYFVATVAHAKNLMEWMRRAGIACAVIDGSMSPAQCDQVYAASERGGVRVILTVHKALTGVNLPHLDFGGMVRATNLPHIQRQAGGRLMRRCKGKFNALWGCWGKNVERLGAINEDVEYKPKQDPKFKMCGECKAKNLTFNTVCNQCGFPFPESDAAPSIVVTSAPSTMQIIRNPDGSRDSAWSVSTRTVTEHRKSSDSLPVLAVRYYGCRDGGSTLSPQNFYSKFLSFNAHKGSIPHRKACDWWRANAKGSPPSSVADAIMRKRDIYEVSKMITRKQPGEKYPDCVSTIRVEKEQTSLFGDIQQARDR